MYSLSKMIHVLLAGADVFFVRIPGSSGSVQAPIGLRCIMYVYLKIFTDLINSIHDRRTKRH